MDRRLQQYVDMTTWEQGKARARELVKESAKVEKLSTAVQWAWGDLCLEVVPEHGKTVGNSMMHVLLGAWMEEYEFPYSKGALSNLRYTCRTWPKDKRTKASFAAHTALANSPQRFDLITDFISVNDARLLAGKSAPSGRKTGTSPIERASAVKSWSRSLSKMVGDKPSEDVVNAVADAWYAVTELIDRFGILDEMFAEYEEQQTGELAAA